MLYIAQSRTLVCLQNQEMRLFTSSFNINNKVFQIEEWTKCKISNSLLNNTAQSRNFQKCTEMVPTVQYFQIYWNWAFVLVLADFFSKDFLGWWGCMIWTYQMLHCLIEVPWAGPIRMLHCLIWVAWSGPIRMLHCWLRLHDLDQSECSIVDWGCVCGQSKCSIVDLLVGCITWTIHNAPLFD